MKGEVYVHPLASAQRERMAIRRADRRLRELAVFFAGFATGVVTLVVLVLWGMP